MIKNEQNKKNKVKRSSFKLMEVLMNVLCALFGVGNSKRLTKSLESDSASPYIIVGILTVLFFILFLFLIIKLILSYS